MGLPSLPMTAGPSAAGSADGIAITGGDVYEVRFFDPAGSLTQIARLSEAPPVRTDAHVETYVRETHKELRERIGDELDEWYPGEEEDLARHRDLPLLPDLPAYVQLRFADTGGEVARLENTWAVDASGHFNDMIFHAGARKQAFWVRRTAMAETTDGVTATTRYRHNPVNGLVERELLHSVNAVGRQTSREEIPQHPRILVDLPVAA